MVCSTLYFSDMAAVLRTVVGRMTSSLSLVFSMTARSLVPHSQRCLQSQRNFTSSPQVASCFAATTWTPLSPFSSVPSPVFTTTTGSLLAACTLNPVTLTQRRHYHVRVALKKRCSGCYFVHRKGRLFMECKLKPRHRQMQVMSKRKTWKEDYSKGNIERALFWKYDSEKRYYKLGDNEYSRHNWLKGKIGVTV